MKEITMAVVIIVAAAALSVTTANAMTADETTCMRTSLHSAIEETIKACTRAINATADKKILNNLYESRGTRYALAYGCHVDVIPSEKCDWDRAIADLEKVEGNPMALFQIYWMSNTRGDHNRALRAAQKMTEIIPKEKAGAQAVAHYYVGEQLFKKGDLAGARRSFVRSLEIDPKMGNEEAKKYIEQIDATLGKALEGLGKVWSGEKGN
jgi:tetratricopeptide (TPR) repeat protein